MLYVFDTNSFLILQSYTPGSFQSFWTEFDASVARGEIISVKEVLRELKSQVRKTWFQAWLKQKKSLFLAPTKAEGVIVADIFKVGHFQNLVGQQQMLKGGPAADPFVIACAKSRKGCVVTEEVRKPNSAKIPNVCDKFSVDCICFEDFLGRQGWKF